MNHLSILRDLLARVRQAAGPNRNLDCDLARTFGALGPAAGLANEAFIAAEVVIPTVSVPIFTGSVNSTVALIERVLPGWQWQVHSAPAALLYTDDTSETELCLLATAPLSLLGAMLEALIAKAERTDKALSELAEMDADLL